MLHSQCYRCYQIGQFDFGVDNLILDVTHPRVSTTTIVRRRRGR